MSKRLLHVLLGLAPAIIAIATPAQAAPTINTQPADQTVIAGGTANFTVSATGSGTLSYHWRHQGSIVQGTASANLAVTSAGLLDSGFYDVVVADSDGSTTSTAARLDVRPATYPNAMRLKTDFAPRVEMAGLVGGIIPGNGGTVYVFGDFLSIDSAPRSGVARLFADGSLDTSFNPAVIAGDVHAAVLQTDGKLVIGGTFRFVGGASRSYVARLNVDGSLDAAFLPGNGFDAPVHALALMPDGRIAVGGYFGKYNGDNAKFFALLNSDGPLDTAATGGFNFSDRVLVIQVTAESQLMVGGRFTTYNSIARPGLVRVNLDGSLDTDFNPNLNTSPVRAFAIQPDGRILVAHLGGFRRLNSNGSLDTTFSLLSTIHAFGVSAIQVQPDGKIIIGGGMIWKSSGDDLFIARLQPDGSLDSTFYAGVGFDSPVYSLLLLPDGRVLAGGPFTSHNGTERGGIALLDTSGNLQSDFTAVFREPAAVTAFLPAANGKWIIAGRFSHIDGTPRSGIARLNADGTLDPAFESNYEFNGRIRTLARTGDGRILAGGGFGYGNGFYNKQVVRLNADGTLDGSFDNAPDISIGAVMTSLVQADGRILCAGGFWSFNSLPAGRISIIRLNPDGTRDSTFDPGTGFEENFVYDVTVRADGRIVASGNFTRYRGTTSNRIVGIAADGTVDPAFVSTGGFDSTVQAVELLSDGRIVACGSFGTFDGVPRSGIARLNSSGTLDAGFNPGAGFERISTAGWVPGIVPAMVHQTDGKIIAGGFFTRFGGVNVAPLVRLNADGTLDPQFVVGGLQYGVFGRHMTFTAEGNLLVAGTRFHFPDRTATGLMMLEPVPPPAITTQPSNQTVNAGQGASFTVAAGGADPLTYRWKKDGVDLADGGRISGAASATLTISDAQVADAGSYTVAVSNSVGSVTSKAATLTVAASPPAITSQLASQTVTTGHSVTFVATAGGDPAPTHQWQVSTDNGATWTNLTDDQTSSGSTTTQLAINATLGMNGYQYRYVATNSFGTATSNALTLSVVPAHFPHPTGIAMDGSGNLYIADASSNTVQKVSAANVVTALAGSTGAAGSIDGIGANARFNTPSNMAVDSSGNIYVADKANHTIRKITAAGVVTTLAGSAGSQGNADSAGPAARFNNPTGVAVDGSGNVYVADTFNHTIRKITPAGVVATLASASGVPGGADGTGTAARFKNPSGVAVDSGANVYVADTGNNMIRKITSAGVVTTLAGTEGVAGTDDGNGLFALFNQPGGVAVDGAGNVYVADTGNATVRKITPAGEVSTLAGLPGLAGLKDGAGLDGWLSQPGALTVDSAGNVYVADTGNAAIRKITAAGDVSTLVFTLGGSSGGSGSSGGGSGGGGSVSVSSGGGGGGGALDSWFYGALALLCLARLFDRRR